MALAHDLQQRAGWRALGERALATLDEPLRQLIAVEGSLTRSLRELCHDNFRLRLIAERPANGGRMRLREVLMLCSVTPWVFAQSLIPQAALNDYEWLNELGDRPLGDTLFEHADVQRLRLRFGQLDASDPLFQSAVADAGLDHTPHALWARSSVLRIGTHDLAVNEVFLPAIGNLRG